MKHTTSIAFILCALLLSPIFIQAQDQAPARRIITPERFGVNISSLGGAMNSSGDDFAPMMLGNGRVMYFTSNRDGSQAIYSAVGSGSTWEQVQKAGPPLNLAKNEGGASITPDGYWMVFTACNRDDSFGDCDLYIAEYIGGSWRNVRNLGPNVNSPEWDSQPTISADGLTIVFSSERPGGQGGTDLWMTTRSHGGDWGRAVNLGPLINTIGDEMAPVLAADGKTLYFSSDMHPGIGGMDVYMSRKNGGRWSEPVHLGAPINTEYDDYFCGLSLQSQDMYFASDRPGGKGGLDLYIAVPNPMPPTPVTTVVGRVSDITNDAPVDAVLTVRDIRANEIVSTFHSDGTDGSYVVILHPGREYAITAEAPGFLFYSDHFNVPAGSDNTTLRKDIGLTRDLVRLLVFFDFDKSTLQRESHVDLDRAAEWLKANPGLSVEVAGHTDNVGPKDYNRKLSQDRAEAVVKYLVNKGISSARLRASGYGMDQPIVPNDTEENRAKNRRVEFRVVSR